MDRQGVPMTVDKVISIGIAILGCVISLATFIGGWMAVKKIQENHLFHVDKDLQEIKVGMKQITEELSSHSKQIATISVRLEERTVNKRKTLRKK